jgi:hypothetical protein
MLSSSVEESSFDNSQEE